MPAAVATMTSMPTNQPVEGVRGQNKSRRSFYGCVRCKKLKRKCDEKKPCGRCASQGQPCIYQPLQVIAFDPSGSGNASSSTLTSTNPKSSKPRSRQLTPELPRDVEHRDENFAEKVLFPSAQFNTSQFDQIRKTLPDDAINFMSSQPAESNGFAESSTTIHLNNYMLQSQLFSAFYGPSKLSLHQGRTQWLAQAIDLPDKSRALSQALTAVSCSRLAWISGDLALQQKSLAMYSRAITSTQNALWRRDQVWSDQTLAAIRLLQMYEAMESPSKSLRDYFMHIKGMGTYLVEKIKMDGHFSMNGLGHELVKDFIIRSSLACFAHGDNIDNLVHNMISDIIPYGECDQASLTLLLRLSDFRFYTTQLGAYSSLSETDVDDLRIRAQSIESEIQRFDDSAADAGLYDDTESIYHRILSHSLRIYLSKSLSPFADVLEDLPSSPPDYSSTTVPQFSSFDDPSYLRDPFASPLSSSPLPALSREEPTAPDLSYVASHSYRVHHITRIGNLLHLITGTSALEVVLASNLIWALNPWKGVEHVPSGSRFAANTGLKVARLFESVGVQRSMLPKGMKREYESSGAKGFGSRSGPDSEDGPE